MAVYSHFPSVKEGCLDSKNLKMLLQMTERHSRHGALMNGSEKRYKNQSCFYSISKKGCIQWWPPCLFVSRASCTLLLHNVHHYTLHLNNDVLLEGSCSLKGDSRCKPNNQNAISLEAEIYSIYIYLYIYLLYISKIYTKGSLAAWLLKNYNTFLTNHT